MKGGITPTPVTPAAGESILKPRFRRDALSPADKSMTKLITLGDIYVKCCFGDRVTHWTMAILSNTTDCQLSTKCHSFKAHYFHAVGRPIEVRPTTLLSLVLAMLTLNLT